MSIFLFVSLSLSLFVNYFTSMDSLSLFLLGSIIVKFLNQIKFSIPLQTSAWYSEFLSNISTTVWWSTFLQSYHCFLQSINHYTLWYSIIVNNNNSQNHEHNNNNSALTSVRCENMGTTAVEGPARSWPQQRATHTQ